MISEIFSTRHGKGMGCCSACSHKQSIQGVGMLATGTKGFGVQGTPSDYHKPVGQGLGGMQYGLTASGLGRLSAVGAIDVGDYITDDAGNVIGIPTSGSSGSGGIGAGWNTVLQDAFKIGAGVFQSQFTARPTYSQTTGPQGSSTQYWGATPGGLTTLGTGISTPNIGTYLLLGAVALGAFALMSGGHK